jgi:hypothetical protein
MFAVYAGFRGLTASLPLALARSGVPGPAHGLQRFMPAAEVLPSGYIDEQR